MSEINEAALSLSMRGYSADEVRDMPDALEELQEWKDGVEGLMGQYGVENIKIILDIVEAARRWGKWYDRGLLMNVEKRQVYKQLIEVVHSYDTIVAERKKK